ncbi:MAG: T9SS type A sorting domain-containing protein [Saprospiraceae bacterium]|nr:T9SS type A sorting domain-containing protein [Saprospiraceae bacterium]
MATGVDTMTVDTFLSPGNVNTIFKTGPTCPVNQNFTGTVAAGTYQVSNAITTSGTTTIAAATTVVFDAGVSVTLSPGFTAAAGSTFTAKIGGCTASLAPTIVEARTEEIKASVQENLVIYPNPLSESTTIAYELVNPTEVSVLVMDVKGKQVANLVNNAKQDAGTYYVNFDASNLTSGLYIVIVRTGDKVMTEKISVAK